LYGRAEELSALRGLIEQFALVTIVGSAGIGKTRLAEAITYEVRDRFSERVFVQLAPLLRSGARRNHSGPRGRTRGCR
jgi:predicted ATPase